MQNSYSHQSCPTEMLHFYVRGSFLLSNDVSTFSPEYLRMAWFGRDLKDQSSKPQPWAGLPPTKSGCPEPIQPGTDHLQDGGIHSFSGPLTPVPHCSLGEQFPPDIFSPNLPREDLNLDKASIPGRKGSLPCPCQSLQTPLTLSFQSHFPVGE